MNFVRRRKRPRGPVDNGQRKQVDDPQFVDRPATSVLDDMNVGTAGGLQKFDLLATINKERFASPPDLETVFEVALETSQRLLEQKGNKGRRPKLSFRRLRDRYQAYDREGSSLADDEHYDEALRKYCKALELKVRDLVSMASFDETKACLLEIAVSINNIAFVQQQQRDLFGLTDVAMLYESSLYIKLYLYGNEKHSTVGATWNNIGSVHFEAKNYKRALYCFRKARQILREFFAIDHLDICLVTSNIGDIYFRLGDWTSAVREYRASLRLRWILLGPHDKKVIELMNRLATAEMKMALGGKRDFPERENYGDDIDDDSFAAEVSNLNVEIQEDINFFESALTSAHGEFAKDHMAVFRDLQLLRTNTLHSNKEISHISACISRKIDAVVITSGASSIANSSESLGECFTDEASGLSSSSFDMIAGASMTSSGPGEALELPDSLLEGINDLAACLNEFDKMVNGEDVANQSDGGQSATTIDSADEADVVDTIEHFAASQDIAESARDRNASDAPSENKLKKAEDRGHDNLERSTANECANSNNGGAKAATRELEPPCKAAEYVNDVSLYADAATGSGGPLYPDHGSENLTCEESMLLSAETKGVQVTTPAGEEPRHILYNSLLPNKDHVQTSGQIAQNVAIEESSQDASSIESQQEGDFHLDDPFYTRNAVRTSLVCDATLSTEPVLYRTLLNRSELSTEVCRGSPLVPSSEGVSDFKLAEIATTNLSDRTPSIEQSLTATEETHQAFSIEAGTIQCLPDDKSDDDCLECSLFERTGRSAEFEDKIDSLESGELEKSKPNCERVSGDPNNEISLSTSSVNGSVSEAVATNDEPCESFSNRFEMEMIVSEQMARMQCLEDCNNKMLHNQHSDSTGETVDESDVDALCESIRTAAHPANQPQSNATAPRSTIDSDELGGSHKLQFMGLFDVTETEVYFPEHSTQQEITTGSSWIPIDGGHAADTTPVQNLEKLPSPLKRDSNDRTVRANTSILPQLDYFEKETPQSLQTNGLSLKSKQNENAIGLPELKSLSVYDQAKSDLEKRWSQKCKNQPHTTKQGVLTTNDESTMVVTSPKIVLKPLSAYDKAKLDLEQRRCQKTCKPSTPSPTLSKQQRDAALTNVRSRLELLRARRMTSPPLSAS